MLARKTRLWLLSVFVIVSILVQPLFLKSTRQNDVSIWPTAAIPTREGFSNHSSNNFLQNSTDFSISLAPSSPHLHLDLVLISDRGPNSTIPLQALVNSLLYHTTEPIRLNIVTSNETDLPWLTALNVSEYFSVYYHDPSNLARRSIELLERANYSSGHYSSAFATQKIFLPTLAYPSGTFSKVLMLDDDMVFYQDAAPLVHQIRQYPEKLSLYCPVDPVRVHRYFTSWKRPNNGHPHRYCIAGMIGFPLGEGAVQTLSGALQRMTEEYPGEYSRWSTAEQDAINRYLAEEYHSSTVNCSSTSTIDFGDVKDDLLCGRLQFQEANGSSTASTDKQTSEDIDTIGSVDLIPCDWSCDWNACIRGKDAQWPPQCSNCPNVTHCRSFHFLAKSYKTKPAKHKQKRWPQEARWHFYNAMEPREVLRQFDARVGNNYS